MRSISRRLHRRLRILAVMVAAGFMVGLLYRLAQGALGTADTLPWSLLASGLIGAGIGGLVGGFELVVLQSRPGERLRRLPFAQLLALRSVVATISISAVLIVGNALLYPSGDIGPYLADGQAMLDLVFAFAVSVALVFIVQVRQIVGSRLFTAFVFGRYYRPVRERRVFLFIDLADSTGLAQQLGDEGVHALITQFFFDLTGPVLEHGAEIHRYVGDQAVVTWPYAAGVHDARCLRFVRAVDAEMRARQANYQHRFGLQPRYRVGIHGGSVVAGECGEDHREIVFFGDTVNTAARIQSMCKMLGSRVLISGTTLGDMQLPAGMTAHTVGMHQLRGRSDATELYVVELEGPTGKSG